MISTILYIQFFWATLKKRGPAQKGGPRKTKYIKNTQKRATNRLINIAPDRQSHLFSLNTDSNLPRRLLIKGNEPNWSYFDQHFLNSKAPESLTPKHLGEYIAQELGDT
ncbi:MAG: hypothetical protein CSA35_04525 [Dethiosulfovibrio peptidovorans]|nr:MAG: hypothetical protein CSA35_04525 [Dethiosulfovibrio peptidovorans]